MQGIDAIAPAPLSAPWDVHGIALSTGPTWSPPWTTTAGDHAGRSKRSGSGRSARPRGSTTRTGFPGHRWTFGSRRPALWRFTGRLRRATSAQSSMPSTGVRCSRRSAFRANPRSATSWSACAQSRACRRNRRQRRRTPPWPIKRSPSDSPTARRLRETSAIGNSGPRLPRGRAWSSPMSVGEPRVRSSPARPSSGDDARSPRRCPERSDSGQHSRSAYPRPRIVCASSVR